MTEAVRDYLVALCAGGQPALARGRGPPLVRRRDPRPARRPREHRAGEPPRPRDVARSRSRWAVGGRSSCSPLTPAGRLAFIDAIGRRPGRARTGRPSPRAAAASRSTSRSSSARARSAPPAGGRAAAPVPGSVPEALYEPLVARLYATPAALPVAATAAAAGQAGRPLPAGRHDVGPGPTSSTRRSPRWSTRQVLEPVGGRRTATGSATSSCGRSPTSCSRPRGGARSTTGSATSSPATTRRTGTSSPRTSSARSGTTRPPSRTSTTAERARRRGALAEARAHLTRAIDLVVPLAADRGARHREVQLRLRRGFLAMSAEGAASADASADFDRCLELAAADPAGDDMVSTLISLWAYDLSRAELERAREVSETLRDAAGAATATPSGRRTSRASGCSTGSAAASTGAVDDADRRRPTTSPRWVARTSRRRRLVRAQRPDRRDARAPRARAVHGGRRRRRGGEPRPGAGTLAAALDFPQGPWSAAYATWLGSWMWIEAGRLDRAGRGARRRARVEPTARVRLWELIADDAGRGARRHRAPCRRCPRTRPTCPRTPRRWRRSRRPLAAARAPRASCPSTSRRPARCSPRRATSTARAPALRGVAGTGRARPGCASTTPRRGGASRTSPPTATPVAARCARRSSSPARRRARPFELRIALDLHELRAQRRARTSSARCARSATRRDGDLEEARARLLTPR